MPRIIRVPKTAQKAIQRQKALVPYLEEAYRERVKDHKEQLKRPPGHKPIKRLGITKLPKE